MAEEKTPTPSWKDPAWLTFLICSVLHGLVQTNIVPPAHWLAKLLVALLNVASLVYLLYTRQSFPGLQFWKKKKD